MNRKLVLLLTSVVIVSVVAAAVHAYTTDQATRGKEVYVKSCAACHGADGSGGTVPLQFGSLAGIKVPALVGPKGLPGMKDVGQVYEAAKTLMPPNKPGSLKDQEYLDVVSFALQANGIAADNQLLTPESAKKIKLGGKK
jgi:cytochrome c